MLRESLVFFLGLAVALAPFAGIPSAARRAALVVAGLALMLVGYQLRRAAYLRSIVDENGERKTDAYVEQVVAPVVFADVSGGGPEKR